MKSPEFAPKFYIKGPNSFERYANLEKLAKEKYKGNFSEMVNDALNKAFHLDPLTGKPAKTKV